MASLSALARPYARAAFSQAKESGSVPVWDEALQLLALLAEDAELSKMLGHPLLGADKTLKLVMEVAEAAKVNVSDVGICNFVNLLVQQKIINRAPEIYRQFQKMRHQDEGVVMVQAHSAVALSAEQLAALEQPAAKVFSASKVELSGKLNPSLLGGLMLQAEDRVLDLSLREKLRRMERAFA